MGIDDFYILEELGQGAFGTVFKVRRKHDNLIYAMKKIFVKKLSEKEKDNTLNQIRILSSIQSSFVISYKEAFYDEKSQSIYIILEFADGGDLDSMIKTKAKEQSKFSEDFIWKTVYQILRGLRKLHQGKIIHRDIKPANIIFSKGLAKLSDMNISKFVEEGAAVTQIGTPYYRSPEVWSDEPFTEKGDVWSLGCVVYEMIMLEVPFKARMIEGLYVKIMNGVYDPPKNCSEGLLKLVKRCLVSNPLKRASVQQLFKFPEIHKYEQEHKKNTSLKIQMKLPIEIPQDFRSINDLLPQPNYSDSLQKRLKSQTSAMKQLNKKRPNSTIKKSTSKTKMNKTFHKSTKCLKIQSFKFIDVQDTLQPKTTKQLGKSSKKIKSMKRII